MNRVGIYIETGMEEFTAWLEQQTHAAHQEQYPKGNGIISLEPAQKHPFLQHHLGMEIDGIYINGAGTCEQLLGLIHFSISPIGQGKSIEVVGRCDEVAVMPYLVRLTTAIGTQWSLTNDAIWVHEPRQKEHQLAQLKLKADWHSFEAELKEFASTYQDDEVRFVTIRERRDSPLRPGRAIDRKGHPIEKHKKRSWEIGLGLRRGDSPWEGIDRIDLDFEVSRIPGKYPLLLTITLEGFKFKAVDPFIAAFLARCQAIWRTVEIAQEPNSKDPSPLPTDLQPETRSTVRSTVGLEKETARSVPTSSMITAEAKDLTKEDCPWELIVDHCWDRKALELWWQNHACLEIAEIAHVSERRIFNRLSELRRIYGERIVPTKQQRLAKARPGKKLGKKVGKL